MVLPTSGPLSLQDIQDEFGGTSPISLSEYYAIGKNIPASGVISIQDFYGGIDTFSVTISSNQVNLNLRSYAVSQGWDEYAKLLVTINSGVVIYANATNQYALVIDGAYQRGVTLVNNGTIVGMGGNGGTGGVSSLFGSTAPTAGGAGGPGLNVQSAVSVENNGTIAGGGGGGGGGAGSYYFDGNFAATIDGGGGGGGRTGLTNSSGGGTLNGSAGGQNGAAGTFSSAGTGGAGGSFVWTGGKGGNGGNWGAAGANGGTSNGQGATSVGAGGAAGAAVVGSSNITWLATGTRLGAIS